MRRCDAFLGILEGLEDLPRSFNVAHGRVALDEQIRDVRRHVHAARAEAVDVGRDEVHAPERDERVDHRLVHDCVGHRRAAGVRRRVRRDGAEDGDGLVEVLLHAAPGVDERRPVGALYRDAAVRNEVVEDLLHRGEVDGLDASIRVDEELSKQVRG